MIKYYADFVSSSNEGCFMEHPINGQTFPNLFLPILEVNRVKNIKTS